MCMNDASRNRENSNIFNTAVFELFISYIDLHDRFKYLI